jgi:hypothetical protein
MLTIFLYSLRPLTLTRASHNLQRYLAAFPLTLVLSPKGEREKIVPPPDSPRDSPTLSLSPRLWGERVGVRGAETAPTLPPPVPVRSCL